MFYLLIMVNNLLHDLSVAMFFCSSIVMIILVRDRMADSVAKAFKTMKITTVTSFILIILFGIGRTLTYRNFEWYHAVQNGQVTVLIIKHILFVLMIVSGGFIYFRLRNEK